MPIEIRGDVVATCGDETIRLVERDDAVQIEYDAPRRHVLSRLYAARRFTLPERMRPPAGRPLRVVARGCHVATIEAGGVRTRWSGLLAMLLSRQQSAAGR